MAKITHQEMRRGSDVSTSAQKQQNYVVDDLSGGEQQKGLDQRLSAFEESPQEEEQVVAPPKAEQPLPAEIKKKLEKIIFMGRHSKTIELAGHKFDLSTITHKENNEIMSRLMKIGEVADLFTIRVLTLSYALRSVDSINLSLIDIEGEFKSELDHNIAVIDNMQVGLVERLYTAYEELVKESDNIVYGAAIKN